MDGHTSGPPQGTRGQNPAYRLTHRHQACDQGKRAYEPTAGRVGASVEFVPHILHTSNNRPSGQRGFFYHWRVGAEVVANTNYVLMYNPST